MGTWGTGILDNDTSAEKLEEYFRLLDNAVSHDDALTQLQKEHVEELQDPEVALDFWVGIAEARWRMGVLDAATRAAVAELADADASYGGWAGVGSKELSARRRAIATFLAKLDTTPKRIRKPRKPKVARETSAIFAPGDCLAVKLDSGLWSALLVVETNRTEPWHRKYVLNEDVVYQVTAPQPEQPTLQTFDLRGEVVETRFSPNRETPGFLSMNPLSFTRDIAPRVLKLGNLPVRDEERRGVAASGLWHHFLQSTQ